MFGYAVRNDWLARNPCRFVNLPPVEGTRRFDLTPEDVAAIAVHVPDEYRPMIWIGAALGLRWSEVAALRVGRLDLDAGRLTVAEGLTRGTGGRNVFGPPKSKLGTRTMFMPKAVVAMLLAHLERAGFSDDDADELVFTDEEGGPLRYSNWRRRVWLPPPLRPAVPVAQTRLGHADPRTTLAIYASAPASIDRAAADVIGARFFGEKAKKASGTKSPRHVRAIPSDGSGASES
jgi:integrase